MIKSTDAEQSVNRELMLTPAEVQNFKARKVISPNHSLELLVAVTSLRGEGNVSSKLLPVIVGMWEDKKVQDNENPERYVPVKFTDFYSFDHNGILLSHGYSRIVDGKTTVDEAHDLSVSRLHENREYIREMLGKYPLPLQLTIAHAVSCLRDGCIMEHYNKDKRLRYVE